MEASEPERLRHILQKSMVVQWETVQGEVRRGPGFPFPWGGLERPGVPVYRALGVWGSRYRPGLAVQMAGTG